MKIKEILSLAISLLILFSLSAFAQNNEWQNKDEEKTSVSKAIDTAAYDKKIAETEQLIKTKPKNTNYKKMVANAYAERAFALVNSAQYRASLADFRRCLKLNPRHKKAKEMYEQVISVFEALNIPVPKEGEEPPPLPFKKS